LVRIDPHLRCGDLAILRGGLELGIIEADQAVREMEDSPAFLIGHAEKLRDHLKRQFSGDLLHELALALVRNLLENAARDLADVRLELSDRARRKAAGHKPAVLAVPRRIHTEHHALDHGELVPINHLQIDALHGGEDEGALGHVDHVTVLREHPESRTLRLRMPVERGFASKRREDVVRKASRCELIQIQEIDLIHAHGVSDLPSSSRCAAERFPAHPWATAASQH